jgi:hypothetical protein
MPVGFCMFFWNSSAIFWMSCAGRIVAVKQITTRSEKIFLIKAVFAASYTKEKSGEFFTARFC